MELEYMDNTKNDHYYLEKIKTDIAFIVAHMKDVDAQELNDNEILLDSMLFRMIQILGLWQRNKLLAGTAVPFFVIHTINGIINFAVKR